MKVTIYSTVGKKAVVLENLTSTNWGDLKTQLRANDVSYSGMKAVVGETRVTLESDKALLPEADFSLFLMPVKTKSGADRKSLMQQYKNNPAAQAHFKGKGLQITRMKTDAIEAELKKVTGTLSQGGKIPTPEKSEVEKAGEKAAQKAVEKMKEKKSPATSEKVVEAALMPEFTFTEEEIRAKYVDLMKEGVMKIQGAITALVDNDELEEEAGSQLSEKADELIEIIDEGLKGAEKVLRIGAEAKAKLEAEAKAKKEAEKKLAEELDKTAHDIAKDFSDLKSF